jgi:hypothetical protein
VSGDSILSITLLVLFIKPLKDLKRQLGSTPRAAATLANMERMTKRNRNLLLFTVTVTITFYTTIAVVGNLAMRTVIYMCAIDRLVTLKCITMTFAYDRREYYYCYAFFILFLEDRTSETVGDEYSSFQEIHPHDSVSTTLVSISSTTDLAAGEEKLLS